MYLMAQSFKLVCVLQKEASPWNHISSLFHAFKLIKYIVGSGDVPFVNQSSKLYFLSFFTNQVWCLFLQLIHQMLDCRGRMIFGVDRFQGFKWKGGDHQWISTADKYRDLHYTNHYSRFGVFLFKIQMHVKTV